MADLGRRALEGADPDALIQLAVESVVSALDVEYGSVLELDPESGNLRLWAGFGWREDVVGIELTGGRESLAGFTLLQDGPVIVDDLEQESRFEAHPRLMANAVRSSLAVPLRGTPRPLGVLAAHSTRPGAFGPDDVFFMRSAGNVLAAALARARIEESARRGSERLRFLAEASASLDASLDPSETLGTIASLAVPGLADICVIDLLDEDGGLRGVAAAAEQPELAERLHELRRRFPLNPGGAHPVARVLREGEAELFARLEPIYAEIAQSDEHLNFAREARYHSAVVAPLTARGRTLGAISLIRLEGSERYGADDLELVRDLGLRAAMALDNARLYAHQHEVAETLQRSLLPQSFPEVPGLRFEARYLPGGPGVDVGGDWYDVVPLPGGRVGLAIGDVAGRGLEAARAMGELRTTLRVFSADHASPADALTRVDRVFQRLGTGDLATLLFLALDPATGAVTFSSAAHPPPLVVRPDGAAYYLDDGRSLPLGVVPNADFTEASAQVEPGSTLLLYTDGLVERPGENIEEGLERLRRVAAETPEGPVELTRHVLAVMLDERRPDDVAVLAVHLAPVSERLEVELSGEPEQLAVLRDRVRVWLGRQNVSERLAEDLTLACSEVAANALEHAYTPARGPVAVRGERNGEELWIAISDRGSWRAPRESERGRGLGVVDALVDRVEIVKGAHGTEVRMARRLTVDADRA